MSEVKCRWVGGLDKGHDQQLITAFHYYGCESNRMLTIRACYRRVLQRSYSADRHRVNDFVRNSKGSWK